MHSETSAGSRTCQECPGPCSSLLTLHGALMSTWHRFPTVTARIFVRYRRPVHINRELLVTARVTSSRGRRIHVDGNLREVDEILAEARCAFLHVSLDHFLRTPEGRAAGEAWSQRLGS